VRQKWIPKYCPNCNSRVTENSVLRVEERRGRIRAEKRIRQLTEKGNTGLKRDCDNPTLTFRPIGYVSSSFLERNGCPRQSGVVPSARCILRLEPLLNPTAIVDGLSQFRYGLFAVFPSWSPCPFLTIAIFQSCLDSFCLS